MEGEGGRETRGEKENENETGGEGITGPSWRPSRVKEGSRCQLLLQNIYKYLAKTNK
jgi:hypothetical protein